MVTRLAICAAAVCASLGGLLSSANAASLVYNDTTTSGSSTYPGDLVETFAVNQANLYVVGLAAFDQSRDGISTDIYVGLFDDTANSVAIGPVNFTGTSYNGTGGSYFDTKSVTAYNLIAGHTYSIEAWGFNSTDGFYLLNGGGAVSFNSLGGSLTNVSGTAAVGHGATNIDGSSTGGLVNALCFVSTASCEASPYFLRFNGTDFAAAGSLVIRQTPLPAALPLFGTGLGALGLLGWRRKRRTAAIAA